METIGAFEAKTHLSELLQKVEAGGEFTITRHGKPVAKLIPVTDTIGDAQRRRDRAVDGLLKLRERYSLGKLKAKDLIEQGRKY